MNVLPFSLPEHYVRPLMEVIPADKSESGLFKIYIWKNRSRSDGMFLRVPTHNDVMTVVRLMKETFEGGAHG